MPSVGARLGVVAALLAGLVLFGGVLGILAYHQVPEGHTGVTKEWGAVTGETLTPGAHLKVPIAEGVQDVETRPRTYTMSQTAGEGDRSSADAVTVKTVNGSSVDVDVTVRYRIDRQRADQFVTEWNDERQMERRLIRPTIRTQLRDEASSLQTTGETAIYTRGGRVALEETAIEALREEFDDQPLVLEAVQIRNIDLPDRIDQTLEEKEQAKQQVQVERERIRQEEARAEQKRIRAQGDADVVEIEGEALRNNPIVLEQQAIQALDEGTVYVVPQGQNSPPILVRKGRPGEGNATVTSAAEA